MTRENKRRITEESIASRLRSWRKGSDLGQSVFADAIGVSFSSYKDYEYGKIQPGSEALKAFANHGLDINWLLTGKPYNAPSVTASANDKVVKNISATADSFKELAANIICNAFHSEAEGFVAEFLTAYELVLNASDEEALTEQVCGFFANFGGDGSAHDVLWRFLCRRIDERFPLKGFVNV